MAIKAEQIKVPTKPEEQISPLTSTTDIETRVKKLEEHAFKHSHSGTDKSQRIGGIWKRLNEPKPLASAVASVDIEVPEGYRMYRLYFLGGLSTAAYLAVRFNDNSNNAYAHNVSVFQGAAVNAGTSITNVTDRGYIAYISGTSANAHFVEATLYDTETGVNTYRGWTAIGHSQTIFDGAQTKSCIATGHYNDTSSKFKKITVLTSAGTINASSIIVLEGLTI